MTWGMAGNIRGRLRRWRGGSSRGLRRRRLLPGRIESEDGDGREHRNKDETADPWKLDEGTKSDEHRFPSKMRIKR